MDLKKKWKLSRILQNRLIYILTILVFGSVYAGYILNKSKEYAEIVNLSGKIRGDIQRFSKLYFAGDGKKCFQVKDEIKNYFYLLSQKVDDLNIPLLEASLKFYPINVRKCWNKLEQEVFHNPQNRREILKLSEECWKKANQQTDFYQKIAERNILILEIIYYLLISVGAIVNLALLYLVMIKKTFRKLEIKANFDTLTGAYNRIAFYEMYPFFSKESYFQPLSLMMLDIDNFKSINDTYGHNMGDIVLKTVAETVKKHLRRSDIFVRWGGEEFIVLLPHTDLKGALKVAEKLRKDIESLNIPELKGKKVTASFGVTEVKPKEKLEEVIFRADMALYKAKREGKNRVEVYV